jgi:hypothetical protein
VGNNLEIIWMEVDGLNFRKSAGICLKGLRQTRIIKVSVVSVPAEARMGHLPNTRQKRTCSSGSN